MSFVATAVTVLLRSVTQVRSSAGAGGARPAGRVGRAGVAVWRARHRPLRHGRLGAGLRGGQRGAGVRGVAAPAARGALPVPHAVIEGATAAQLRRFRHDDAARCAAHCMRHGSLHGTWAHRALVLHLLISELQQCPPHSPQESIGANLHTEHSVALQVRLGCIIPGCRSPAASRRINCMRVRHLFPRYGLTMT